MLKSINQKNKKFGYETNIDSSRNGLGKDYIEGYFGESYFVVELTPILGIFFVKCTIGQDEKGKTQKGIVENSLLLAEQHAKEQGMALYIPKGELDVYFGQKTQNIMQKKQFTHIEEPINFIKNLPFIKMEQGGYVPKGDVESVIEKITYYETFKRIFEQVTTPLPLFEVVEYTSKGYDVYYNGFTGFIEFAMENDTYCITVSEEGKEKEKSIQVKNETEMNRALTEIFYSIRQKTKIKNLFEEVTYFFDQQMECFPSRCKVNKKKLYETIRKRYSSAEIEAWCYKSLNNELLFEITPHDYLFFLKDHVIYLQINHEHYSCIEKNSETFHRMIEKITRKGE